MKGFILALAAVAALAFASSAEAGGLGARGCGPNGCGNFNSRLSINHRSGLGLGLGNFGGGFSHTTRIRHRQGGLLNRRGGFRHSSRTSVNF